MCSLLNKRFNIQFNLHRSQLLTGFTTLSFVLLLIGSAHANIIGSPENKVLSPLTSEQVKHWIAARIELAHIQNKMKQNAHLYDDLPVAYHEKSVQYLTTSGYGYERFTNHKARISAARTYITDYAETVLEQEQQIEQAKQGVPTETVTVKAVPDEDIQDLIRTMRELGMPEDEIQSTVAKVKGATDNVVPVTIDANVSAQAISEMEHTLAAYKAEMASAEPDVPAVRVWLAKLRQFDSWYANNGTPLPAL
jgi:uncharacterized protein YaaQ